MGTAVLVGSVGVYALVASGHAELHVKPFSARGALDFVAAWPPLQPVIKGLGDMGKISLPDATGTSPWLWIAGLLIVGLAALVIFVRRRNQPSSQNEQSSLAYTQIPRSKCWISWSSSL